MSAEAQQANLGRRHFLVAATTITGLVGVGFTAVPFLASWRPSARAQALGAPVEVDISKLEPGQLVKIEWRGKAIFIVNRTPRMLESLAEVRPELRDPESKESEQPSYVTNEARAIRPEYLIVVGVCTHLGCAPLARFEPADAQLGADWRGGFYCPCHGSRFDLAGRVYKDVPAPTNLAVPPHRYLSDSLILIGSDTGAA